MTDLAFSCRDISADRYAAAPSLTLRLGVSERTGTPVHAIALRCQIRVSPRRRDYTREEQAALRDLFGEPGRWRDTLLPLHVATVPVMVPGFTDTTEVEVPLAVTYDVEVAWARYLDALRGGELPLSLLFSGTVFVTYDGGFGVEQLPWTSECAYRMPVRVFRELMEAHFPGATWLRLQRDVRDELARYKADAALPTWDATLRSLLAHAARSAS